MKSYTKYLVIVILLLFVGASNIMVIGAEQHRIKEKWDHDNNYNSGGEGASSESNEDYGVAFAYSNGGQEYWAWNKYFSWGCNPLKGFCIPQIIREDDFSEISYEAGLVFDRPRLYKNISQAGNPDALQTELISWCEERISALS